MGADLTQFRLGMNEVEARLHQVDVRERGTSSRLAGMVQQARRLTSEADAAAARRAQALIGGTSFSRAADDAKAARQRAISGDSDAQRRVQALAAQRQALDISPLIQKARTADAALTAAVENQRKARRLLDLSTQLGVERDVAAAESLLKKSTADYTRAAAAFKKAQAELEAHAAKATGLGEAEGLARRKAAQEIAALGRQEDELRRKHQAYLDTLSSREGKLRAGASVVAGRMPGVKAEADAAAAVAEARAANIAQDAFEHRVRAANAISQESIKVGAALAAGLAVTTKVGADFNQMLLQQQHNTTLSATGMTVMSDAVKRLGVDSGAPLDELAKGFRRSSDLGFTAAQSTNILSASMKAAVATGSDLGETTFLLARAMKEYNIPASKADQTMGLLVETSRRSALSMGELVHVSGQLNATAANLGLSFLEVQAALITYTRHGLDASQASTQLRNDISKIIAPSAKTQTALRNLAHASKAAGVDLARDFTTSGLRAKGLLGVWEDIVKVAAKYKGGVRPEDLAAKLFPNLRGTIGAVIATGTGFKEYGQQMEQLRQTARNGVEIDAQYKESLEQINQQLGRLKNAFVVASGAVAKAFTPAISQASRWLVTMSEKFNSLSQAEKTSIANSLAVGATFLILAGTIGKLIVGVSSLSNALFTMTGVGLAGTLAAAGPVIAVLAGVTLATGGLVAAIHYMDTAEQRANQQLSDSIDERARATAALSAHAISVDELARRYDVMISSSDGVNVSAAQLQSVMDQIGQLSPGLVTGWDNQGHALALVAGAADQAAEALAREARAATIASATQIAKNDLENRQRRQTLADQKADLQRELAAGRVTVSTLDPGFMGGEPSLERHEENLSSSARAQRAAQIQALDAQMAAIDQQTKANDARIRQTLQTGPGARLFDPKKIKPLDNTFGQNFRQTNPGVDPLAGLYDKDKKDKKKKQTDAEKEEDRYFEAMKSQRQAQFLTNNQGREGEALWETQAHGYVKVGGELRKVTGDFYGLSASMRAAFVNASRLTDFMVLQKKVTEDLADAAADANRQVWAAQGQRSEREKEMYDFEHKMGAYKDDKSVTDPKQRALLTGAAGARHGFALNVIGVNESVEGKKAVVDLKAEIAKPLESGIDSWWQAYSDMLEKIRKEKVLYLRIGEDQAQGYAKEYADNIRLADSTSVYNDAIKEANATLEKLVQKDDDLNKVTFLQTQTLELAKPAYDNLTKAQKDAILAKYAEADSQQKVNTADKEGIALKKLYADELKRASSALESAKDPRAGRLNDYIQAAKDKAPDRFKDLSPAGAAAEEYNLSRQFNKVEAIDKETEAQSKLTEIMQKVKDRTRELSSVYVQQDSGLEITRQQWDRLSQAQKNQVLQLERLSKAKQLVSDVIQGLDGIVSRTLDDLHEHGFKNFFKDVLGGFDDMIWNIGKKFAEAQFTSLLNNALGGLVGAIGGGSSGPWGEQIPTGDLAGGYIGGRSAGANSGMTVVNLHIHSPDARGVVNSAHQIAQTMTRHIQAAQARG